jgi:DNA segregation ATPase FtsK/SpoIIIE, S-DNA-T family
MVAANINRLGQKSLGVALCAFGAWIALSVVLGGASAEVLVGLLGVVGSLGLAFSFVASGVTTLRSGHYGLLRAGLDLAWVLVLAGLGDVIAEVGGALGALVGDAARAGFGGAGAIAAFFLLALLLLAERFSVHTRFVRANVSSEIACDLPELSDDPRASVARTQDDSKPVPVVREVALDESAPKPRAARKSVIGSFALPSPSLFATSPAGGGTTEKQLWSEAEALEGALAAYDVRGKVQGVTAGPVVSTFEVSLPSGTKFSKVVGLSGDVGMQLGRKVRVVPARPGRVGFEVQNETRAAVGIRELLEDPSFEEACRSMSLPVVVGRDVRGRATIIDLAAMPHMIVAGSTGSGKSVAVNAMLSSLLVARTPEDMRLLLIDPKVVELMPYSGVPHLLAPPVSDVAGATKVLSWCVEEMERRYATLAAAGCKSIQTYNQKHVEARLPFVVVVVDELADLMMQGEKAIEPLLVRLGQKARAAGIHVVIATQRPSVDVVTGLIKSNFPARLGFRVAQAVDSRVVLDEAGAESLLGKGDALLKAGGADAAVRVQCPWVSEEDVERLAANLKAQGPARYDAAVLAEKEVAPKGSKKSKEGRVWS